MWFSDKSRRATTEAGNRLSNLAKKALPETCPRWIGKQLADKKTVVFEEKYGNLQLVFHDIDGNNTANDHRFLCEVQFKKDLIFCVALSQESPHKNGRLFVYLNGRELNYGRRPNITSLDEFSELARNEVAEHLYHYDERVRLPTADHRFLPLSDPEGIVPSETREIYVRFTSGDYESSHAFGADVFEVSRSNLEQDIESLALTPKSLCEYLNKFALSPSLGTARGLPIPNLQTKWLGSPDNDEDVWQVGEESRGRLRVDLEPWVAGLGIEIYMRWNEINREGGWEAVFFGSLPNQQQRLSILQSRFMRIYAEEAILNFFVSKGLVKQGSKAEASIGDGPVFSSSSLDLIEHLAKYDWIFGRFIVVEWG